MEVPLEIRLWRALRSGRPPRDEIARMVAEGLCVEKEALRTLEKWSRKGWYDYGSSLDLGWFTGDGSPFEI